MPNVSFEYFPPRTEEARGVLRETVETLSQFQPVFQSVTYGAGGSDRDGSLETIKSIKDIVDTAGHLTYTGSSLEEVKSFANELWDAGIKSLVALRGDNHGGHTNPEPFESTAAFIRRLVSIHPFQVAVGCYPETHPQAASRASDIATLKEKQDAGATLAITQFFFDNSKFYSFVEEACDAGVTIPIVPGILPIYNFDRVCKMAKECGTEIPDEIYRAFKDKSVCGSSQLEIASELLKAQVHDLACAGYESIHIYTLNRAELAIDAAEAFLGAQKWREVA